MDLGFEFFFCEEGYLIKCYAEPVPQVSSLI